MYADVDGTTVLVGIVSTVARRPDPRTASCRCYSLHELLRHSDHTGTMAADPQPARGAPFSDDRTTTEQRVLHRGIVSVRSPGPSVGLTSMIGVPSMSLEITDPDPGAIDPRGTGPRGADQRGSAGRPISC